MECAKSEKLLKFIPLLEKYGIDGYLIPHNDAHDSEYISEADGRIEYISGFSGSNGLAFISRDCAYLWTDSRYFIQAEKQLEKGWIMKKMGIGEKPWFEVVAEILPPSSHLGFDSFLFSNELINKRTNFFKDKQVNLKVIGENLVDLIWEKKEIGGEGKIWIHGKEWVGRDAKEKIEDLKVRLAGDGEFYFLTAKLDEIAYILNLRGCDIPYNPVFIAYLLINFSSTTSGILFIDSQKVAEPIRLYLKDLNIEIREYGKILEVLKEVDQTVYMDGNQCSYAINQAVKENLRKNAVSPIEIMKAVKNNREQQGFRDCHERDALAVIRYFHWLETELLIKTNSSLNEYNAAEKLDSLRMELEFNKGLSFDTISSVGPNAAIVHYKPEKDSAAQMDPSKIYLVDSGGQYLDGTTDITRTIHLISPTSEEKKAYTRVLLGNLDLERTKWPSKSKISGSDLDAIVRRRLWEAGLDYGHGTGHGVGYCLNVHEGPHRLSKYSDTVFQPGMIVTNEPGYYLQNSFGIRIENCLLVIEAEYPNFLGFENLTLVPYDKKLMDFSLMSRFDVDYVNEYHRRIWKILSEKLEGEVREWLEKATEPI